MKKIVSFTLILIAVFLLCSSIYSLNIFQNSSPTIVSFMNKSKVDITYIMLNDDGEEEKYSIDANTPSDIVYFDIRELYIRQPLFVKNDKLDHDTNVVKIVPWYYWGTHIVKLIVTRNLPPYDYINAVSMDDAKHLEEQ